MDISWASYVQKSLSEDELRYIFRRCPSPSPKMHCGREYGSVHQAESKEMSTQPAQSFVTEEIGQEQICQGWEGAKRARVMGKMGTASEGGTGGLRQEPCEDYENRAEDV